jgi:hypothetical protein
MRCVDDRSASTARELGLKRALLLQVVEIFKEKQPAGLLDIIELGRAARFFPQNVVDILEGLFEH